MSQARQSLGGSGDDNTSALAFGGGPPASGLGDTETWNGSNWTDVADLNTTRTNLSGAGTNTAALAVGGSNPTTLAITESWNGSIWTETSDMSLARNSLGQSGSSTTGLAIGGYHPVSYTHLTLPTKRIV